MTNGLVTPAYCMVPQGVFGFLDDPSLADDPGFRSAKAMDALKGTEFEGGKNWPEITMYMRANEEHYNANIMAEDIVAQLKKTSDMDVKIQTVPQSNFSEQLFQNKWQLVFIRWWADYPDPNNMYGDMFYSRKASGKRQAYSSDAFDDLVEQGKAEPDPDKRLAIYLNAEKHHSGRRRVHAAGLPPGQLRLQAVGEGPGGEQVRPDRPGRQHLRPHADQGLSVAGPPELIRRAIQ